MEGTYYVLWSNGKVFAFKEGDWSRDSDKDWAVNATVNPSPGGIVWDFQKSAFIVPNSNAFTKFYAYDKDGDRVSSKDLSISGTPLSSASQIVIFNNQTVFKLEYYLVDPTARKIVAINTTSGAENSAASFAYQSIISSFHLGTIVAINGVVGAQGIGLLARVGRYARDFRWVKEGGTLVDISIRASRANGFFTRGAVWDNNYFNTFNNVHKQVDSYYSGGGYRAFYNLSTPLPNTGNIVDMTFVPGTSTPISALQPKKVLDRRFGMPSSPLTFYGREPGKFQYFQVGFKASSNSSVEDTSPIIVFQNNRPVRPSVRVNIAVGSNRYDIDLNLAVITGRTQINWTAPTNFPDTNDFNRRGTVVTLYGLGELPKIESSGGTPPTPVTPFTLPPKLDALNKRLHTTTAPAITPRWFTKTGSDISRTDITSSNTLETLTFSSAVTGARIAILIPRIRDPSFPADDPDADMIPFYYDSVVVLGNTIFFVYPTLGYTSFGINENIAHRQFDRTVVVSGTTYDVFILGRTNDLAQFSQLSYTLAPADVPVSTSLQLKEGLSINAEELFPPLNDNQIRGLIDSSVDDFAKTANPNTKIPIAKIGSNTPASKLFLRGDNVWSPIVGQESNLGDFGSPYKYDLTLNSRSNPAFKITQSDLSLPITLPTTGNGTSFTLTAKYKVPGGIIAGRKFLTKYEGAIEMSVNQSTTLYCTIAFSHVLLNEDGTTLAEFVSKRPDQLFAVGGGTTYLQLNDFNSETTINLGEQPTRDGTMINVTQDVLNRDLKLAISLSIRAGRENTQLTVLRSSTTAAVHFEQLADVIIPKDGVGIDEIRASGSHVNILLSNGTSYGFDIPIISGTTSGGGGSGLTREQRAILQRIPAVTEWKNVWTVTPDPEGIEAPTTIDYDILALETKDAPTATNLSQRKDWANRRAFNIAKMGDYHIYLRVPRDTVLDGRLLIGNLIQDIALESNRCTKMGDVGDHSFYFLNTGVGSATKYILTTSTANVSLVWQIEIVLEIKGLVPEGVDIVDRFIDLKDTPTSYKVSTAPAVNTSANGLIFEPHYRIVPLSQSEYDNLDSYDDQTLYVII